MEAAWKWATKTGNLRKSEIHGEEEARLCLSDTFTLLDEEGQEISISGKLEVDAACMHAARFIDHGLVWHTSSLLLFLSMYIHMYI